MTRRDLILERMAATNPLPDLDRIGDADLAAMTSLLEDRMSAPRAGPARDRLVPEPPRRRRLGLRPAVVLVSAFIVVLGIIGALALLPTDRDDVVDTPPSTVSTTLAPTTTTETTTAPTTGSPAMPPSDLVWSRVPHDESLFGGVDTNATIWDIVYAHDVWVAGGWEYTWDGGPISHAAVWWSGDGTSWQRVSQETFTVEEAGEGKHIRSVTASDRGFVAVGYAWEPDQVGAVWISDDGSEWRRVPDDAGVFGDDSRMGFIGDVIAVDGRVFAAGSVGDAAAVWSSDDGGRTWTRVPHDEAVFGREDVPNDPGGWSQSIGSITAGPHGLVAVGRDGSIGQRNRTPDQEGAVWVSQDGVEWQRVPAGGVFRAARGGPDVDDVSVALGPVAWTGERYVAAGHVRVFRSLEGGTAFVGVDGESVQAAVWHSPDGIGWSMVPHDPVLFGDGSTDISMQGIAAGPGGVVIVGQETVDIAEGVSTNIAAVWTSADGVTWTRAPTHVSFADTYMRGIARAGDGFIAVGGEAAPQDEWTPAAIWIAGAP